MDYELKFDFKNIEINNFKVLRNQKQVNNRIKGEAKIRVNNDLSDGIFTTVFHCIIYFRGNLIEYQCGIWWNFYDKNGEEIIPKLPARQFKLAYKNSFGLFKTNLKNKCANEDIHGFDILDLTDDEVDRDLSPLSNIII